MISSIPDLRIRSANDHPIVKDRECIVYWMTAFRRTRFNFALERAVEWSVELQKPLVILEALRLRYRWASDRFHRFVIEGMRDNQVACESKPLIYYPYVELEHGAGRGLVEDLAKKACLVVSDDFPCFFHPHMIRTVAKTLPAKLEVIDSNGLMPLRNAERTFTVAHSYRRWMQKELPTHLQDLPAESPLERKEFSGKKSKQPELQSKLAKRLSSTLKRWKPANITSLLKEKGLAKLPIDHTVGTGVVAGGSAEAGRLLEQFLAKRISSYDSDRNVPDELGSSELSPHLHFGHIASQEIFLRLMEQEKWNPSKLQKPNGKMNGFWNVGEDAEAFLDQLCTWREIGFNMCWREKNYDRLESLPDWTQKTIAEHANDPREYVYTLEQFENAQTHDEIWNAAQRQLVREGRIHNYLRMLWGKKILHWTATVSDALDIMIDLNNKYALDGRDPNSYSGIFWVLGRYDRAWGPERPIFGKIRYMTSESTAKKHKLGKYLQRFSEQASQE
ncbi:MAG: deoxyribodipyrimidine photolyase [Planctomycetota bacterium]